MVLTQPQETAHSYTCLGFWCKLLGWLHNKTKFPSGNFQWLVTLIYKHSSGYFVRCFSMSSCCNPYQLILLFNPWIIWGSVTTIVLGQPKPVITRCLILPVKCFSWYGWFPVVEWMWHYTQISKHQDEMANQAFNFLAVSLKGSAIFSWIACMVNYCDEYMVLWWIV